MDEQHDPSPTATIADLDTIAGSGGVVWSTSPSGVHANLVVLAPGESIAGHVNDAVDVVLVVVAGTGSLSLDDDTVGLTPHRAVLIPRGAHRAVTPGDEGVRYLTIHAAGPPLAIGNKDA